MSNFLLQRGGSFDEDGSPEFGDRYFDGVIDDLSIQAREPEQVLWRAVIAQAVVDAAKPVRKSVPRTDDIKARWMASERDRVAQEERDDAIGWLTSENEEPQSFNWIALHVFDMEPKVLRERIATATPALQEVIL